MSVVSVPILSENDKQRFMARVGPLGPWGCKLWTGAKFKNGYGEFRVSGKKYGAHRISWLIFYGDILDNLCVLHNCPAGDNRLCVNPEHLWLGTKGDNIRDCAAKGRTLTGSAWQEAHDYGTSLPSGSQHHNHIRCAAIYSRAEEIKRLHRSGISQQRIADTLGVSQTLISKIIRGIVS